jgi:hypothetical protein
MENKFFQKLSFELSKKYTKDELAELLVKYKDARIAYLITSAFNKSCIKSEMTSDVAITAISRSNDFAEKHYMYLYRTIGPNSTEYKAGNTRRWRKLVDDLNEAFTKVLTLDRMKVEREVIQANKAAIQKARWLDSKY